MGRKELKHQVNEVEDFLELVTACHLTSAAMHFFGMKLIDDSPSRNGFSEPITHISTGKGVLGQDGQDCG